MYIHKMSCLYTTCHVCRVCTTHVVYVQHVEYVHNMSRRSCMYNTCGVCTQHVVYVDNMPYFVVEHIGCVVYVQHAEYVHNMSRRSCMYNTYCMYNKACMCTACCTGWQRLKGCLICTGHFSKRALLLVVNLRRLTFDLRHPVSSHVIFRKRA